MGRRACVSFGLDQTIRFPRRSDVCEALQCVRVCWHTRVCMQNGLNVGMRPCYRACYDRTHFHYVQRERETERKRLTDHFGAVAAATLMMVY